MPASSPRHALGWLDTNASFRALTERADRMLALQADLRSWPQARGLVALSLEDGTLEAGAPGAAAAAKARQFEPSLVAHLVRHGWAVRRVRFRPLPAGSVPPAPPSQPKTPMPSTAVEAFRTLSADVGSPALREALRQLVAHRTRRHG